MKDVTKIIVVTLASVVLLLAAALAVVITQGAEGSDSSKASSSTSSSKKDGAAGPVDPEEDISPEDQEAIDEADKYYEELEKASADVPRFKSSGDVLSGDEFRGYWDTEMAESDSVAIRDLATGEVYRGNSVTQYSEEMWETVSVVWFDDDNIEGAYNSCDDYETCFIGNGWALSGENEHITREVLTKIGVDEKLIDEQLSMVVEDY